MRIVLDTDVMVAAFRSDAGASRQLVIAVLEKKITLLVSVPLMLEYEAVLTRKEHLSASGLSRREMSDVLDGLCSVIEPIRLSFLWRPALSDPDDDMVLETALNGDANCIVTFNQKDFGKPAKHFGCSVVLPREALQEFRRLK